MPVLQSLGMGSGTLTFDVLDQLREADTAQHVSPIERRATENTKKQDALDSFTTKLTLAKSSTSALSDEMTYLKRSATASNSAVSVNVESGVDIQNMNIQTSQLAQQHVVQSKTFSSEDAQVASMATTLSFSIGDSSYDIDVAGGSSLSDMKALINEQAGDDVTASIINTGDSEYRLVIRSDATGSDSVITFNEGANLDLGVENPTAFKSGDFTSATDSVVTEDNSVLTLNIDGEDLTLDGINTSTTLEDLKNMINADENFNTRVNADIVEDATTGNFNLVLKSIDNNDTNFSFSLKSQTGTSSGAVGLEDQTTTVSEHSVLQAAQDAKFKYNGVDITRSTNTVDDIVLGVEFTLNEVHEDGKSTNLSVTRNDDYLLSQINDFVSGYNTIKTELDSLTKFDADTKEAGIFQGDGEFNRLKSSITRDLLSTNSDGLSLLDFGFTISESGTLTFDESKFNEKMDEDPSGVEAFFRQETTTVNGKEEDVDGVFSKINNLYKSAVDSSSGFLTYLDQEFTSNKKRLEEEHEKAVARLDAKYETMAAKFAAYDTEINRINSGFSSLQMMIDTAINS